MGAVVKIGLFLAGLIGLSLTGLNGAQDLGVDTNSLLAKMGETPGGVAASAQDMWGGLLNQVGGLIANAQGEAADPENPGALVKWGPEAIVGLVSALLMFFSTRR